MNTKGVTLEESRGMVFWLMIAAFLMFVFIAIISNILIAILALIMAISAWGAGVFCVYCLVLRGDFEGKETKD